MSDARLPDDPSPFALEALLRVQTLVDRISLARLVDVHLVGSGEIALSMNTTNQAIVAPLETEGLPDHQLIRLVATRVARALRQMAALELESASAVERWK